VVATTLKGTMKFTIKMLVIIRCLEVWRYFLEGAKSQFEIWMDHKNLEYFMKA